MPWIAPAIGIGANLLNGGSNGGGGNGGNSPMYMPTDEAGVDTSWQNMFNQQGQIANQTNQQTSPYYGQSLAQGEAVNYQPYLQGAQQAGGMYGQVGQTAGQQMQGYGQQAQTALGQQSQMYGAGNQIMQTAFDPQNALFNQQQQLTQDQVRAGQAARGLGNSAEGAMEENQAMGNFDINWQNAQLGRQVQGIQGMQTANAGGIAQGNLYGQDQSAALAAGNTGAQAYGMSGQVPMQAQQYAAAQPGAVASQYQQYMSGQQGLYGAPMGAAQSYMGLGQSAGQANYNASTAQNAAETQMLGQLGTGIYNNWNSNGGNSGGTPAWGGQTTSAGGSADAYNLYGPAGYG